MQRRSALALPILTGWPGSAAPQTQPSVVASFSVLGDLVRQIAGDGVALRVIAGPEVDAHEFQPRPSDAAAMRGATLLVRNGLGFEPWFDRLARVAGDSVASVVATAGIEPLAAAGRGVDPHAWQDVRLAIRYVANITAGLIAAVPDGATAWTTGAAACAGRLAALDAWVRAQIATVPAARREVITAHRAFGYFAAAYGIRFAAPQGFSTAAQPSAAAVAALIRQIRSAGTAAIFVENVANPATLDRLAREAGVRVRGRLYADALSPPDGPAATYEAMIRHNVGLLVPAMRGDA